MSAPKVSFLRWIWRSILCIVILGAAFCAWLAWYIFVPGFPTEERETLPGGSVVFNKLSLNRMDLDDWIQGLRLDSGGDDSVRFVVRGVGAHYFFTASGHVYALFGNESGLPASVAESWAWSGNPHEFPFYHDYNPPGP